ncbi:MAG: DUF2231 domain-containing protein [Chloroflexi bacterium]|nr:MAG: DUF2231 domain-containing protein [Chloroflexota bacterium]
MILFGHPLHPMTVHFPIALFLLGVLLTLVYLRRGQPEYDRFAFLSLMLSELAALVASLTGLLDQNLLAFDDPRRQAVNPHITAAVALLVVNGLLVYMRLKWPDVLVRRRAAYLGLMAAGTAVLLATAWLGGELVYRWQVGVQP